MSRLQKYVEWMSRGRRTDRIAYVTRDWDLPEPLPGAEWQIDAEFSPTDELLRDPELKQVFKSAIEKGAELVIRRKARWRNRLKRRIPRLPQFVQTGV